MSANTRASGHDTPVTASRRSNVITRSNNYRQNWRWSQSSDTLTTGCKELSHRKRPWCWERLRAGGEGDHRGWDGWMASPTQWTWVWANSGRWWRTGTLGVLKAMGSQRVRHNWATKRQYLIPASFLHCRHSVEQRVRYKHIQAHA